MDINSKKRLNGCLCFTSNKTLIFQFSGWFSIGPKKSPRDIFTVKNHILDCCFTNCFFEYITCLFLFALQSQRNFEKLILLRSAAILNLTCVSVSLTT